MFLVHLKLEQFVFHLHEMLPTTDNLQQTRRSVTTAKALAKKKAKAAEMNRAKCNTPLQECSVVTSQKVTKQKSPLSEVSIVTNQQIYKSNFLETNGESI